MDNEVYNYKIKASIREDCPDYERLKAYLEKILGSSELVPLGNNEYGSDDWAEQSAMLSFLEKQDWFIENAKELLDLNADEGESDDPESEDFYDVEDWLEFEIKRRKGEWYP